MAVTISAKTLSGYAIKGAKAHAQPDEVFFGGSATADYITVTFKSRKHLRLVTLKPSWHDGDFVWLPEKELVIPSL